MATISEDYVSFECAKLLKEKGFAINPINDDWLSCMYDEDGNIKWGCYLLSWYPCITLQMACKWLREVHGLHISLEPCYDYDSMHVIFLAFVQNVADVHEFMEGRKNVASYPNAEKSYELAIKYCLENLI